MITNFAKANVPISEIIDIMVFLNCFFLCIITNFAKANVSISEIIEMWYAISKNENRRITTEPHKSQSHKLVV